MKDATTDESTIRAWWTNWPDANIGIATGATSGIVVIDVDNRHGGKEQLFHLEAEYGDLPFTCIARTGNGHHLYFKHPGVPVKCVVGRDGSAGIDIRGDGGYVVAPPSLHFSGKKYLWEKGPDEAVLTEMPTWLVTLLSAMPGDGSDREPVGGFPKIPKGQRNATLTSLAGTMRRRGMGQAAIELALLRENQERCAPPLSESEVTRITKSVARYPHSANSANSARQGTTSSEWEPPTPFHEFDQPSFPTDALPDPFRAFVEAEAIATQTPRDLPGMLSLSVVAAASARLVAIRVRDGWIEPINLYIVVVLDPGERKSPVFATMVAPLEQHEREECRRTAPEIAVARNRLNIAVQTLKKMQDKLARATVGQTELSANETDRLAREIADMRVPAEPRLLADDTTPERLVTLLDEQHGRMAVMSDEGGIFDLMGGRYSSNSLPNFDVYLKGYSAGTLRADRVGRPRDYVDRSALTIGLTIQPEVLRGLIQKAGFQGRGLLGRFLYSCPRGRMGGRDVSPPPVPPSLQREYQQAVLGLLALPLKMDDAGTVAEHLLDFESAALDSFLEFARWVEPQLAPYGDLGTMTDWGGKLVGTVVRLCGVLHMAEHSRNPTPWQRLIGVETVKNAILIANYLIAHAKSAYAEMGADPAVEGAKYLLGWIKRAGVDSFTKRDAFEGTKGRFKKVTALESVLALLCDHGYIREHPVDAREGPGRRASPTYDVSPYTQSQNSHNSQNYSPHHHSANTANCASPDLVTDHLHEMVRAPAEPPDLEVLSVRGFE